MKDIRLKVWRLGSRSGPNEGPRGDIIRILNRVNEGFSPETRQDREVEDVHCGLVLLVALFQSRYPALSTQTVMFSSAPASFSLFLSRLLPLWTRQYHQKGGGDEGQLRRG